jgi:uncharacterized protein YbjT (DUF2867 family)
VVLSSIGSEKESGLGLITSTHLLERALDDLPFPTAFVRAAGFLENYAYAVAAARATGRFDTFLTPTDRRVALIATEDIGKEVARLLTGGFAGKKIVEIGSPWSAEDVARALSEVVGRAVEARAIPREQWATTLEAMGFPRGGTAAFEEMEDGFNSGWIAFGVPGAEPVAATITPARFFAQIAASGSQ